MIGESAYLRLVRASAWYDLAVTVGFATPWTFAAIVAGLQRVSGLLGIAGHFPAFEPAHMLMANLLGSIVTLWALLRLRGATVRYGRYDAAGRLLFALWEGYALAHGAPAILWGFLAAEIGFGIAEALPLTPARPLPRVPVRT